MLVSEKTRNSSFKNALFKSLAIFSNLSDPCLIWVIWSPWFCSTDLCVTVLYTIEISSKTQKCIILSPAFLFRLSSVGDSSSITTDETSMGSNESVSSQSSSASETPPDRPIESSEHAPLSCSLSSGSNKWVKQHTWVQYPWKTSEFVGNDIICSRPQVFPPGLFTQYTV